MIPTVVPEPPHFQPHRLWLAPVVNVAIVVESCIGSSVTSELFTTLEMFCTVAVTSPFTPVLTPATYFVCCDGLVISQPQPFCRGAVVGPD